jgi:hypothetical protein
MTDEQADLAATFRRFAASVAATASHLAMHLEAGDMAEAKMCAQRLTRLAEVTLAAATPPQREA